MERHINIDLLKEYIKTLIATKVILPGILPRQWGHEFTRHELQTIRFTLKFVLRTARDSKARKKLADALEQLDEPVYLHWFLCNHWEVIVPMLIKDPYLPVRKASLQYELN